MDRLIAKLKALLIRYKELILYVFFGGCTTLISIAVYWVCRNVFQIPVVPADVISWILSVIFAYVTNKIWVFESKSKELKVIAREVAEFFTARLFSLGVDVLFMYITVVKLNLPDMWMKITANIIVIILNYVFSKWIIFRKKEGKTS